MKITIPYNYNPRDYQLNLAKQLDIGTKRIVAVWHRRAGKDKTLINLVAKKMFERVGAYYYFFPTYKQGKKILWNGIDRDGFKFMNHIPPEVRKRTDNGEMLIETVNGSLFQVIGTDNIDSIVGTNPVGCVFSEYALQNPVAWDYIRPILAENGGWAIFNYTPRGENHGKELFEFAQSDPYWYAEVLTVEDTGVIPQEVLDQERREIIDKNGDDSLYLQEYMCSFEVPIQGAYYGKLLRQATEDGRVTSVPYDPYTQVDTYWDLGVGDSTAIWFIQTVGKEIHVIDYYETSGEGLQHYIKYLQEKPYVYGRHVAPHDIEVRELSSGKSRKETALNLGIVFDVAPRLPIDDGINSVRSILPRCWFDKENTKQGLNALKFYHKVYDDKNQTYKLRPEHDWSSHGADAFRIFGVSYQEKIEQSHYRPKKNWSIG